MKRWLYDWWILWSHIFNIFNGKYHRFFIHGLWLLRLFKVYNHYWTFVLMKSLKRPFLGKKFIKNLTKSFMRSFDGLCGFSLSFFTLLFTPISSRNIKVKHHVYIILDFSSRNFEQFRIIGTILNSLEPCLPIWNLYIDFKKL